MTKSSWPWSWHWTTNSTTSFSLGVSTSFRLPSFCSNLSNLLKVSLNWNFIISIKVIIIIHHHHIHYVKSVRIQCFSGLWIRRDAKYLSVFSLNAGKYGPEKLQIRTLFTQWFSLTSFFHVCKGQMISYEWLAGISVFTYLFAKFFLFQ